jgi:hypothetical protein
LEAVAWRKEDVQMGKQAKGRVVTLLLIGILGFNFVIAAWRVIHNLNAPRTEQPPKVVQAPMQDDVS